MTVVYTVDSGPWIIPRPHDLGRRGLGVERVCVVLHDRVYRRSHVAGSKRDVLVVHGRVAGFCAFERQCPHVFRSPSAAATPMCWLPGGASRAVSQLYCCCIYHACHPCRPPVACMQDLPGASSYQRRSAGKVGLLSRA